jgi:hypothetical protein
VLFFLNTSSRPFPRAVSPREQQPLPSQLPAWCQRLIELWLLAVLAAFFFIRVLESQTVQRILSTLGLRPIG